MEPFILLKTLHSYQLLYVICIDIVSSACSQGDKCVSHKIHACEYVCTRYMCEGISVQNESMVENILMLCEETLR